MNKKRLSYLDAFVISVIFVAVLVAAATLFGPTYFKFDRPVEVFLGSKDRVLYAKAITMHSNYTELEFANKRKVIYVGSFYFVTPLDTPAKKDNKKKSK